MRFYCCANPLRAPHPAKKRICLGTKCQKRPFADSDALGLIRKTHAFAAAATAVCARLTLGCFFVRASLEKENNMRGFHQAIAELFDVGLARDGARLFSAKTTSKKTTKQV
jgi:hypothetical protein